MTMRKNYLKPLCEKVPIAVQRPLCLSFEIDPTKNTEDLYSRENDYNEYPKSTSVWDD